MFVATTRFTDTTMSENLAFKTKYQIKGVLYPCPMAINPKLPLDASIIVIEMNNSRNQISGISLIKNRCVFNIKNVYSHTTFNRHVYMGKYFVSRDTISKIDEKLVSKLDIILFKGKSHQKRLQGISLLREKLLTDERLDGRNIAIDLKRIIENIYEIDL